MRTLTPLLVGALLVAPFSHAGAQEITAAGTLGTQMTWTALQSSIGAVGGRVNLLETDVSSMKNCAMSGKIWKPGTGCIELSSALLDKVITCGDQGNVYDKSANTCVAAESKRWVAYAYGKTYKGHYGEGTQEARDGLVKLLNKDGYKNAGTKAAGSKCTDTNTYYSITYITDQRSAGKGEGIEKAYTAQAAIYKCQ